MLYKIKNAKLINLIFIFDLLLSAIIAVGTLFYCSLDIYIINILSISIILIIFRVLNAWVPALIIILLLYIMQLGEFFYSGNLIDSYFWDTIFSTNIEESLSFIGTLRKEQIMILLSGLFLIIPIIIINKLICKRQSRYAVFFIIVSIVLILMMLIKSHYHSENLVKKSVIINSLNTYIESRKK
ncbi:hypothetical protein RINTU1_09030 [Candidatus Regiella insecticola]|uniref:Uncharacterized protein n=1 Tax=Candidatus Regiella insecticola TaxID=138073 RepID=A0A6L2ZMP2_9ENTR|nr:hypothetical protein RINTU1_09030 [Candidatus Regiella insecticola]